MFGLELANGFSELTDAQEQHQRFEEEEAQRRLNRKPPFPLPEKFLAELSTMPEAAGIALGLDRIVMMVVGGASLRDVIAFPKTQRGMSPLTGAPAEVDDAQLAELDLKIIAPPPK